jgi:hypothetical protein
LTNAAAGESAIQHPSTAKAATYTQITFKQKQHISTFLQGSTALKRDSATPTGYMTSAGKRSKDTPQQQVKDGSLEYQINQSNDMAR